MRFVVVRICVCVVAGLVLTWATRNRHASVKILQIRAGHGYAVLRSTRRPRGLRRQYYRPSRRVFQPRSCFAKLQYIVGITANAAHLSWRSGKQRALRRTKNLWKSAAVASLMNTVRTRSVLEKNSSSFAMDPSSGGECQRS